MLEMNYYEEKIKEIKLLIQSDIKKANSLLEVELNMPYIPEKYEEEFILLKGQIRDNQMDTVKSFALTEEDIIEYLFSGDEIKEAAAIDSLTKINIRNIKDAILEWLNKFGEQKLIARSFIYEVFAEQEINIELNFDGIQLNPTINKSILDDREVQIALNTFESQVKETPHMLRALVDEFRHYLLLTFPHLPKNGEKFAVTFATAFKGMFDEEMELSEEQQEIQEFIKGY